MESPVVSFIVPCYRLAHLLPDCVNSILAQTYGDFEVLIMDDCSPDNTAEVARSFTDSRVRHVRNDPNMGHLRNYNKGIDLARGRYIWLISADDYLRQPYVLQRYVQLLDNNPKVGYTFCPGVAVGVNERTDQAEWVAHGQRVHGKSDRIISGHRLLKDLLKGNTIVAASGLVRRECYQTLGSFPLNMPWAGDWYLWCLFALHFDVGYFAEPMVCYREHELTMTTQLMQDRVDNCFAEEVEIPWVIKEKADEANFRKVSRDSLQALASIYARSVAAKHYRNVKPPMTLEEFEQSLCRNTTSEAERNVVRSKVYSDMADHYYKQGNLPLARRCYADALQLDVWRADVQLKRFLLSLGRTGDHLRNGLRSIRSKRVPVQ
jgi:glycosyltransferase involved in cell wall biosynthesis